VVFAHPLFLLSTFKAFNLNERLLRATEDLGYTQPTPIQQQAIPAVLTGEDLLACAQTGTGKTAAFSLPMLHLLLANPMPKGQKPYPRCLVLSPTRELAHQIGDNIEAYAKHTYLRHVLVYGGVPYQRQVRALRKGVDIIVGTPGRVQDLLKQGELSLEGILFFVLDEADRMLDMGFIKDIQRIAKAIPHQPQTLMFSATMPPNIQKLAEELLVDPQEVKIAPEVTTAETVDQHLFHVKKGAKMELLEHVLEAEATGQTLIFTRTKAWADKLTDRLAERGFNTEALHGDIRQSRRQKVLEEFKRGKCRVLVATDVAARGLDVRGVDCVINYDMPTEPETYVHRIGRTGRAGAHGIAMSFCDSSERHILREIESTIRKEVPVRLGHPFEPAPGEKTEGGGFGKKGRGGRGRGGFGSKRGGGGGGGRTEWAKHAGGRKEKALSW
jgi:ATP-dependent RNA helicase RhlE